MVAVGKLIQAAGVGVVDEVLQYADAHAAVPRTESFKTWQDYGRVGMFGLALVGPSIGLGKYSGMLETIGIAVTPLLVKSLAVPLKSALGISRTTWMPTRVPAPAHRAPVPAGRSYMPDGTVKPLIM